LVVSPSPANSLVHRNTDKIPRQIFLVNIF
jgi:hypothetical protein